MNLKDEILSGESATLEFKRCPNENAERWLKTVVAFANGKGGRILFGVEDDRTVVGVNSAEAFAIMDAIANRVSDSCAPRISMDLGIENIEGKPVVVLEVLSGTQCPYFLKAEGGKDGAYVRVGATTRRADDATRRELAFLSEGRSFDGEPCPKSKIDEKRVRALCAKMTRIARQNCDSEAERRAVKRITPSQLESWGVVSRMRGRLVGSNAYAVLTGDDSFEIRLKCAVFKGEDRAVFIDRREWTGSVMDLIEKGLAYLLEKINRGCVFKGAFRHDRYELPPDELRELVVNAFAHRSYLEHDNPVFIAVYDDRVEITSPGGLPRGQTPERALAGYSKIRNEVLAKALNYMRYIEEWGSGLRRVNQGLAEYGIQPVKLEDAGIATRMTVWRNKPLNDDRREAVNATLSNNREGVNTPSAYREGVFAPSASDREGVKALKKKTVCARRFSNGRFSGVVDKLVPVVYKKVRLTPGVRMTDLMTTTEVSRATIERALAKLQREGKVEFRGAPKNGGYYAIKSKQEH